MTEYDFAMRLKSLITHETNLCRREAIIAKNLSKYNDELSKVQAKLFQQLEEMNKFHRELNKLKKMNMKLSQFLEEKKMQLQKGRNEFEELQEKITLKNTYLIQERNSLLKEMDILRCFKSSTQMFINTQRLPESIQGVVVCEKENTSQLIPFKIDPKQHTHEEVKDMLWQLAEQSESSNEHWNSLIIGSLNMLVPKTYDSVMES